MSNVIDWDAAEQLEPEGLAERMGDVASLNLGAPLALVEMAFAALSTPGNRTTVNVDAFYRTLDRLAGDYLDGRLTER